MGLDKLAGFICIKGKGHFEDPEAVAKADQAAACGCYRLPKTVAYSVNRILAISLSSIRALETQIKAFDKAIAEQLEIIPNTLTSIKGIGHVYAA